MTQIRPNIKSGNWKLSKHEFYTAYHYSLQYHEWEDKCRGIVGISAFNMDGMPRGTKKSDPTGDMAIKLGDARAQALKASEEANESARRIINIIENAGLTAEEHRLIYLRYIKMPERYGDRIPSWADIANELYVSNRTVHRMHASALKKIADYCNMAHNGTL